MSSDSLTGSNKFIFKSGLTFITCPLNRRWWCIIVLFYTNQYWEEGRFSFLVFHYDTHWSTPGTLWCACVIDYSWWNILCYQPSPWFAMSTYWQIIAVTPIKSVNWNGNINSRWCVLSVVGIWFGEVTWSSHIYILNLIATVVKA